MLSKWSLLTDALLKLERMEGFIFLHRCQKVNSFSHTQIKRERERERQ